jgi:hypothetical protein
LKPSELCGYGLTTNPKDAKDKWRIAILRIFECHYPDQGAMKKRMHQAHRRQSPFCLTPLEFRVLLSACRVFLGTEEPAKLEALLQRGPEWERLLALANMRRNSDVVPFCNAFEVGRGRNDPKIALYR